MSKEDLSREQQIAFEHRIKYLRKFCSNNPNDPAARAYVRLGINRMDNDPDAKAAVESKIEDEMKQFEKWTAEFDSKTDFERMQFQKKIDAELRYSKDFFGDELKNENSLSGGPDERFNADALRRGTKDAILEVVSEYDSIPNLDIRIKQLLEFVRAYGQIESTNAAEKVQEEGKKSLIRKEAALHTEIINASKALFDNLQNEYMDMDDKDNPLENDSYKGLIHISGTGAEAKYKESEEAKKKGDQLKMVAGIMTYFTSLRDGNLYAPEDEIIDYSKKKIKGSLWGDTEVDLGRDTPLFSHEPTPDDIVQGGLGDCYFMAAMASLAQHNPQAIKDAIADNGDGTCTVRLFNRICGPDGPGMDDNFEPVYVKVSKTVPEVGSGRNSAPWVSIMERAYAASGKYICEKNGKTAEYQKYQKVQDFDKLYDQLKDMDKSDWPSHKECPALIDEKGNLHKYEPSYSQIGGGSAASVIEAIGGPEYKAVNREDALSGDYIAERYLRDFFKSVYKAGSTKMQNETQHNNYDSRGENLMEDDFAQMLYVAVMGKEPPRRLDGTMDPADDDVRLAVEMTRIVYVSARMTEERKADIKTGIGEMFKNACNAMLLPPENKKENKKEEKNVFREMWGKDKKHVIDFLNVIEGGIKAIIKDGWSTYKAAPPGTGKYDTAQEKLFFEIKNALRNKNSVVIGTKSEGKTDTQKFDGLYYNHAYTVEGVTTKELNGKEYKFLIVRNPHATDMGRTYEYDKNQDKVIPKETQTKNGLSYIELSDLAQCDSIGINKPHVYEKLIGQERTDLSTESNYSRVLETFEKALNSAYRIGTKDSPAYINLKNAVSDMKKEMDEKSGRPLSQIKELTENIRVTAKKYLEHCDATPERNGSTRTKRVAVSNAIQTFAKDVLKSFEEGSPLKDPKGKLKDQIANTIANGIIAYSRSKGKPEMVKEEVLQNVKKSSVFQKNIVKGDFIRLLAKSKSNQEELTTEYMKLMAKNAAEKKNQQKIKNNDIQGIQNDVQESDIQREQTFIQNLL